MESATATVFRLGPANGSEPPLELVGSKAFGLAQLAAAGFGVPAFFVLTTQASEEWRERGMSDRLQQSIRDGISALERQTARSFATGDDPLLLAVRVSGMSSIPACTDVALDIGATGPFSGWDDVCRAIAAAFESWNGDRAKRYRKLSGMPEDAGLALVVQAMVSPVKGPNSASGCAYSRDPADGSRTLSGAWSPSRAQKGDGTQRLSEMRSADPANFERLERAAAAIEQLTRSPQVIEFVIEDGELYLLQNSRLDVGPVAAARIVLDMVDEGVLSVHEASRRLASLPLDELDTEAVVTSSPCLATGVAASPGVGSGICVRNAAKAAAQANAGIDVVLVRPETSPRDVPAMKTAKAILTERGGEVSHAAIFSREYGIPCVVGCGNLAVAKDGAELTVNGSTGEIFLGRHAPVLTTPPAVSEAKAFLQAHQASGDP